MECVLIAPPPLSLSLARSVIHFYSSGELFLSIQKQSNCINLLFHFAGEIPTDFFVEKKQENEKSRLYREYVSIKIK